jgi:hypothetical protein
MHFKRAALRNGSRLETTLNVPGDLACVSNPDPAAILHNFGQRRPPVQESTDRLIVSDFPDPWNPLLSM